MLHFHMTEGKVDDARVLITDEHRFITETEQWLTGYRTGCIHKKTGWFCRWDISFLDDAEEIARLLNIAAMNKGKDAISYLAVDAGPSVSPRYDVIEAPKVGDLVSRYFNGDAYPAGKIIKMSENLRRIETDDGTVFWRRQQTSSWIATGGTWAMASGHRNDRNPHF